MATYTYEDLANDNVQFLQGTQAQLNLYLPNAPSTIPAGMPNAGADNTFRGAAIEGAFYLTTDTHRLYIGRKVDDATSPDNDKIFPEEVSSGIATVASTGELNTIQTGGEAHDGDFYYIKDSNILAVYEEDGSGGGSWQQINSPTGISSMTQTLASDTSVSKTFSSSSSYVRLRTNIATSGGGQTADSWFKAGDNITLKPSSDNTAIEISSANSQSILGVEEANASINKAPVVLSDNINLDTKVNFVGAQDTTASSSYNYVATSDTSPVTGKTYYTRSDGDIYTAVTGTLASNPSTSSYYERENIVTITGPGINGPKVTVRGTAGDTTSNSGFGLAIEVKNGANASTRNASLSGTSSLLDPQINYGSNGTASSKFYGGQATLNVYTTTETDNKIAELIANELQGVDALHYKGTVTSAIALGNLDDGNLEIGDVYKASSDFTYNDGTNTYNIRVGDLFIANGTETNGKLAIGAVNWEIVPSGNEPLLRGLVSATTTGNPYFALEDQNISGSYASLTGDTKISKRPLYITFDNTNSTLIKAESTSSATNELNIQLKHLAPSSGSVTTVTNSTVLSNSGTDSLTTKDQRMTFTAIKNITRDNFGHVTDVSGETITLKHNYINKITATHSVNNNIGTILIGAQDTLGITNTALTNASDKGNIKITSNTLTLSASNDNTQLIVDLKWGSF